MSATYMRKTKLFSFFFLAKVMTGLIRFQSAKSAGMRKERRPNLRKQKKTLNQTKVKGWYR